MSTSTWRGNGAEDTQPEFFLVSIWCLYTAEICSMWFGWLKLRPLVKRIAPGIYPRYNGILLMIRAV